MPHLALDHLEPHPDNANRMPADLFRKLCAHIEHSGEYPPLIVRRHPSREDRFQILDGHHRGEALRALGFDSARCEIWEVPDDRRAALLLLTLNRLHGEDDPERRGALLANVRQSMELDDLADLLPDSRAEIEALINLTQPPSAHDPLAPPPSPEAMPQAITFFLTGPQHQRLSRKLRETHADRSIALLTLLQLN